MKPIIIFKEKNNDGTMRFTQEELEKLLADAYNQGYADGLPKGTPYFSTTACDTDRNTISTSKDINVSLT